MSWKGFFNALFPKEQVLRAPGAEIRAKAGLLSGLRDPNAFATDVGKLHEAMADLCGVPAGNRDRLIMKHEEGSHGALWAYADASPGHHIGVPARSWPATVAAANRRGAVSSLVHEAGHVALWWDWDRASGRTFMLWPGAVEGFATPVGTYACVRHGLVPAWSDDPSGGRDWLTLEDWANQWIRQGVRARESGASGQDSVTQQGHGQGAAIVEAVLFDLLFHHFGSYEPLKTVLREAAGPGRTPARAARSDQAKMEDFFGALGRAGGRDLADYLTGWGFEVPTLKAASRDMPALSAGLPDVPVPRYAERA